MGGCFSDVKGGQQAVGGGGIVGHLGAQGFGGAGSAAGATASGHNDAVEFFFQTKGVQALYPQLEVCTSTIIPTK